MLQLQATGPAERFPLSRIDTELARVLQTMAEPQDQAVHRARMSNLVVFCDDAERFKEVNEQIPQIVAAHPARVIVAHHEPTDREEPVTGSVNAWCTLAGERRHICSEQVTLYSTRRSPEHLVFAIRGLISGDLPTNLWWVSRTPPALAGSVLTEAAEHVQQVIYDSNGWADPARGVAATAGWMLALERGGDHSGRWRVISDVNWRRLKFWRRILTQALDPNVLPGALDSITEVQVEHGPHAVVQAWLLVSWLASRLGWRVGKGQIEQGVEIQWQVLASHGAVRVRIDRLAEGKTEVVRMRLRCRLNGTVGVLKVEMQGERLVVIPEGQAVAARTLTVQPQEIDELIARQLSDRERDPVFLDAMAVAEVFARSVMGDGR